MEDQAQNGKEVVIYQQEGHQGSGPLQPASSRLLSTYYIINVPDAPDVPVASVSTLTEATKAEPSVPPKPWKYHPWTLMPTVFLGTPVFRFCFFVLLL